MSISLYELTAEAQKILEIDDLDSQTIADTFEGIGLDDKYAAYAAVIKTLKAEEEAIADAIAMLQDKKKAKAKKVEDLKADALESMQTLNLSNVGNAVHGLKIRKGASRGQLEMADTAKWPFEFIKVVNTEDKAGLKQALKEGRNIDGFALIDGNDSLTVS